MDNEYKNNFIECAKTAQKTIFASCSISLTLYLLATLEKIETINIPIGGEVDAVTGISVLVIMYVGLGIVLALQLNRARSNFSNISEVNMKQITLLNSTLISGHRIQRLFIVIIPIAMFYSAMFTGFKSNIGATLLVVFVCSIPYYFAMVHVDEVKA